MCPLLPQWVSVPPTGVSVLEPTRNLGKSKELPRALLECCAHLKTKICGCWVWFLDQHLCSSRGCWTVHFFLCAISSLTPLHSFSPSDHGWCPEEISACSGPPWSCRGQGGWGSAGAAASQHNRAGGTGPGSRGTPMLGAGRKGSSTATALETREKMDFFLLFFLRQKSRKFNYCE